MERADVGAGWASSTGCGRIPRPLPSHPTALLAAAEAQVSAEATWGEPQPLRVWDVRRRTLTAFRGRTSANLIAFSPDGELIAAAAAQRGTDIRDSRTGRLVKRLGFGNLSGDADFSRSVAFSPDGALLFVGEYDGTGRLFSTESGGPSAGR